MIAILDYDAGNIKSVEKALVYLGQNAKITRDRGEIMTGTHVILPGVGNFGDAMAKLKLYGLDKVIYEVVEKGIPFLGICLGLQLLYEKSDESPGVEGLGLLKGSINRIPDCPGLKIPHMGWNSLDVKPGAALFAGVEDNPYVYFVHSYYLRADHAEEVAATTEYSTQIHASVEKDNIYACQFHPEKSGSVGLQILKNFIELQSPVKEDM
ncbi:MAG: imidazole glycerol phosphate synthase subunit HisH [Clostridium sp.]|nr:imidazole glycerol phosphate synthase subunit HisH [Clostridium sp.]